MQRNNPAHDIRRPEKKQFKHSSPGYAAPAQLVRQHEGPTTPKCQSEHSDRGGSPYPASIAASDYCQSASGEVYADSSRDYDMEDEMGMTNPHDEMIPDMDEDVEEDLSSEPPPQRSDGVSRPSSGQFLPR